MLLHHQIEDEASKVHPAPSDAQKEAGNYAKGHPKIHGMEISIETARGQKRSGSGPDGKPWSVKMPHHYGYLRRTEGADGDQIDVHIGPHVKSPKVFVIDQLDAETGEFDEHKAFVGFANRKQAESAYRKSFSDDRAHERMGGIKEMSVDEFKQWARSGDTKNPVATTIAKKPPAKGFANGGAVDFGWVDDGDDPVGAASRVAASRIRQSVMPEGGRSEGAATRGLDALGTAAYSAAAAPSRLVNRQMQTYQPGMDVDPDTAHLVAETATNLVGPGMGGAQAGAAGIFGGKLAKTADHAALARAEQMVAKGANREAIWKETGWFRGADDKWRFEIPDAKAQLNPNKFSKELPRFDQPAKIAGQVWHPDLYEAYPQARETMMRIEHGEPRGSYFKADPESGGLPVMQVTSPTPSSAREIALHEMQHHVQDIEGFARGSNPESAASEFYAQINPRLSELAYQMESATPAKKAELKAEYDELMGRKLDADAHDLYKRSAGEVEARNVQSRAWMNDRNRRRNPPWETEDVLLERQILPKPKFASGGAVNPFDQFDAAPAAANPFDAFDSNTKTPPPAAQPPLDDHGLAERQKLSTVEKAISPITSYPATYSKMKNEALEQAGHGVEQLSHPKDAWDFAKGAGNTALGTLGYVGSPINAAYRSVLGQPVEDTTGIPREYTEFAAQLGTPGLGLTRLNAKTPGAAPGPSELQPSVAGRSTIPEAESAKSLDIPLSRGQATRDLDAIRYEDMAARGAYGPKAQQEAAKFFDEQFKAIQSAGANVGETLGRDGPKAGDVGEAASTVNADLLSTAEKARAVVAEAERRAATEGEAHRGMVADAGRTIDEAVQGRAPAVSNIREAGEVVGQGVRGAADEAAQKYKGLYKEAFDLPGEFGVDTFTNIGNSIKSKIISGESPVIVDATTPIASTALDDLGRIQGLKFANKAHVPGQEMVSAAEGPSEIVAVNLKGVDQARKLLVQRYQQAKARSRTTQDFSDQRAMERIIDGFDDHIEQSISNGLFSGDERALSALQEARAAFSNYRKTFRPNPGDDVSTALNRIVNRNATPEEIGNMITGSGKLGNAGLPVRLAIKLKDVLGQESQEWSAIRQAIWQKASNVRSSAGEIDASRSAQSISDFTNSTLARTVFQPHELSAMRAQSAGMRDLDRVIETLPSAERAKAVKSAYQEAFEPGDIGGSQATVLRRIIDGTATPQETTQAIFSAVNSSSSGNVIRTLKAIEKIVGPESDTMNAIRQGVWQKLTTNAATKDQPGQQKLAQAIGEFLNGNGRLVAKQLYSEPELALMKKYAEAVKLTVIPKYARTNSDTAPAILAAAHKYAGAIAASIGELFGHGAMSAVTGYGVGKMLQGGVNKIKDMKELNRVRGQFDPASGGRPQITDRPIRPSIPPTATPLLSSQPRLPATSLQGTMPTAAEPDQRQ